MNKKPSFFRQAGVLIDRYFHIFVNNRQNLILTIAIPLFTILSVCLVACPDMYSVKPDENHSINDNYPVLKWEIVTQEKKNEDKDDKDDDDTVKIKTDEITTSSWNGSELLAPTFPTKVDGENYFFITQASQLAFLSKATTADGYEDYLTYNYILQVDIDLKKHDFEPIGSKSVPFTGTFDGNGHKIKNLKINSDSNNVGLFGYVKSNEKAKTKVKVSGVEMTFKHNGIVKNLQLISPVVSTSGKNAAAIVGFVEGRSIITSVCTKGGKVSADGGYAGAIVGRADSAYVDIYNCYSRTDVTSKGKNVGGLVGDLGEARLSAAYASSSVTYKGKGEAPNYGSVVGKCDDYKEQLKSVFYDEDIRSEDEDDDKSDDKKTGFFAVKDEDHKKYATGVDADKLQDYSAMLVPFKGIYTAYEIYKPSDENKDKWDDDDYDAEKDKDLEPSYGFKKDDQLSRFTGTQLGLFTLVCVAIFIGVCNSIQEIFKERNILKREYMTNLRLGPYVVSKLVVQAAVCAVQMVVVTLMYALFVGAKQLPESGVIFGSIWIEYYITLFLLSFASDVLALVVSAVVKSSATANTFIPIILIVQIAFSGVMFELNGIMDFVANVMLSKWGIAALAVTTRLNDAQELFIIENPALQLQLSDSSNTVNSLFASTASNLLMIWGILILFTVVCAFACRLILTRVKNDKR